METKSTLFKRRDGFSLIETLIALGLTSIISLSVGYLLVSSKTQAERFSKVFDADRGHAQALLIAKNLSLIRRSLQLTDANDAPIPSDLRTCLSTKVSPINCTQINMIFNLPPQVLFCPPDTSDINSNKATSNKCNSQTQINATLTCTPANCSKVDIEIVTTPPLNPDTNEKLYQGRTLSSRFSIPSAILVDRINIDFSCGGINDIADSNYQTYISSINYATGAAVCANYQDSNNTCTTPNTPMRVFATQSENCNPMPQHNACNQYGYDAIVGDHDNNSTLCQQTGD
jgi:type II secretory pathway pseudopilin PulG